MAGSGPDRRAAVVLAQYTSRPRSHRTLWEVPLEPSSGLAREWAIVCESPTFAAALAGVEPPGSRARRQARRRFEALWTVEPAAVRDAARTAVALASLDSPNRAAKLETFLVNPAVRPTTRCAAPRP